MIRLLVAHKQFYRAVDPPDLSKTQSLQVSNDSRPNVLARELVGRGNLLPIPPDVSLVLRDSRSLHFDQMPRLRSDSRAAWFENTFAIRPQKFSSPCLRFELA